MKTYTIKKKRDGESFRFYGELFADNWVEAKHEFTNSIREDLANDDNVVWLDEEMYNNKESEFREMNPFRGDGYYAISGSYWSLPLLDDKTVSVYIEDVYTWTINKV